jgi:hypothetical protein
MAQKLEHLHDLIYEIRGQKVMLDRELAVLYGVEIKRLNENVKRNIKRFPLEFMFQLTDDEWANLRSQFATFNENICTNAALCTYPKYDKRADCRTAETPHGPAPLRYLQ